MTYHQGTVLGSGAKGIVYEFSYVLACLDGPDLYMVHFKIRNDYIKYDTWQAYVDKTRVLRRSPSQSSSSQVTPMDHSLMDLTSEYIQRAWESNDAAESYIAYDCPDDFSLDEPRTWTYWCTRLSVGIHHLEYNYCEA